MSSSRSSRSGGSNNNGRKARATQVRNGFYFVYLPFYLAYSSLTPLSLHIYLTTHHLINSCCQLNLAALSNRVTTFNMRYHKLTWSPQQQSVRQLIESLQTHRVNTLTELCRIERVAAACENEEDTQAFQGPMTAAWDYYVTSNQMLSELRGLTRNYPFCGDIVTDAQIRVRNDPDSNRSWNLAWLCLVKINDEYVLTTPRDLITLPLPGWFFSRQTTFKLGHDIRCPHNNLADFPLYV